jgi:hypothetical protein
MNGSNGVVIGGGVESESCNCVGAFSKVALVLL